MNSLAPPITASKASRSRVRPCGQSLGGDACPGREVPEGTEPLAFWTCDPSTHPPSSMWELRGRQEVLPGEVGREQRGST